MQFSFLHRLASWQLMLFMFGLMIISIVIGLFFGQKYYRKSSIDSAVLAGMFALLGFLLAFNFSYSLSHFETRRTIIIEESNNIGTTILRTNLYREPEGKLLRADLKKYVEARIGYYAGGVDEEKVRAAQALSGTIQQQIWNRVSAFSKDPSYFVASMQMVPALNSMIDITNSRLYAGYVHLPDAMIGLLILLGQVCCFYMGFVSAGKEKFNWPLAVGACLLFALVTNLNVDLDRPRNGLINLDMENQSIVDLRQMFSGPESGVK